MIGEPAPERKITVLYFAALRELVGRDTEEVVLEPDVTNLEGFARWLEARSPVLRGRFANIRFAVNEEFAGFDRPLSGGDVVALLPPLSGG